MCTYITKNVTANCENRTVHTKVQVLQITANNEEFNKILFKQDKK